MAMTNVPLHRYLVVETAVARLSVHISRIGITESANGKVDGGTNTRAINDLGAEKNRHRHRLHWMFFVADRCHGCALNLGRNRVRHHA